MGPGMGQVGMTEAWMMGEMSSLPRDWPQGSLCNQKGARRSERCWEAATQKKPFAKIHTLTSACSCSLGKALPCSPRVSDTLCQARRRECSLHSVYFQRKLEAGLDGKKWPLVKAPFANEAVLQPGSAFQSNGRGRKEIKPCFFRAGGLTLLNNNT